MFQFPSVKFNYSGKDVTERSWKIKRENLSNELTLVMLLLLIILDEYNDLFLGVCFCHVQFLVSEKRNFTVSVILNDYLFVNS